MRWRWLINFLALIFAFCGSVPASAADPTPTRLYYFSAANCGHCQVIGPKLKVLLRRYPAIELVEHDIWRERPAIQLQIDLLATYGETLVATPTVFLGDHLWIGVDDLGLAEIESALEHCLSRGCPDAMARLGGPSQAALPPPPPAERPLQLPLLGTVEPDQVSLPLVTVVLGLLDSVNPCAFFVLLFLLSLMVHAHSRGRMLTVGLVFVTFSGLIYFLFMAAWLNLFLATGGMAFVTTLAGAVALGIGAFNIKDYFLFRHGPSLSIPERVKPGLYQRVRSLVQTAGYPALLGGTMVLAVAANSYELLCTAGLPMVFTRILTLQGLSLWQYYAYLAAYNVVYVIPLLVIVVLFAVTLGTHRLSENEGRLLKLLSGVMMAEMGVVLLFAPEWLNTLMGTSGLLLSALLLAGVIAIIGRKRRHGNS